MSNIDKLNRLRSFNNRNRLLSNANELIAVSIKNQLKEIKGHSDLNSDGTDHICDSSPYNPEDFGQFDVGNQSYSPTGNQSASPDDSEDEESVSNESDSSSSEPSHYDDDVIESDKSPNVGESLGPNGSISHKQDGFNQTHHEEEIDLPDPQLSKNSSRNELEVQAALDSNPENEYLQNVFLNLEKNLSDVRLGYQARMSNCSIESSILKQDLRRSQSIPILKPTSSLHSTPNSVNINEANNSEDVKVNPGTSKGHTTNSLSSSIGSNSRPNLSKSYSNQSKEGSNIMDNFNLNKWFDGLPSGLRNFVEIESSKNSTDRTSSVNPLDSNEKSVKKQKSKSTKGSANNNRPPVEQLTGASKFLASFNINRLATDNRYVPSSADRSSHRSKTTNSSRTNGNRTQSSTNRSISVAASSKSDTNTSESKKDSERYIDIIAKDYIAPLKEMISEDFANDIKDEIMYFKEDFINLKDGIVDLYNKSPKVLQNLIQGESEGENESKDELEDDHEEDDKDEETDSESENEKIEKKLLVNPNSYYLQSTRNTNSIVSNYLIDEDKSVVRVDTFNTEGNKSLDESKSDCKVFNIYDKYECFDISDQTKLTHVASFDINNPNENYVLTHQEDQSDDEEGKVVTSISNYNIEFLSNLSKVNEKCNMLNTHKISCNLIKPWFTNPINEKIHISTNRSRLSRSSRVKLDEKHVINNNSIKYIIKRGEDDVKYIIDDVSKPNNGQDSKKGPINLYDIENYYNEVDYEYQNEEGKKFYDPISHFEKYKDSKKKVVANTEWATFGRPLVKKTKETMLK